MPELFAIIIFFIVILITAVVFCGWIAFMILRSIFGGVASMFTPKYRPVTISNTVHCPTRGCGAPNPVDARFCRRCGHGLPAAQRVQVRRAAVW